MGSSRPLTFRVENIPRGTTVETLVQMFYPEDQPHLQVKSLAPAVDSDGEDGEYTATILFQASSNANRAPRALNDIVSVEDDFYGFTPLNCPQGNIAADVIAVTGLAAHPFGSWAHSPDYMWLRDYLAHDIKNVRVLLYGYPTQLQDSMAAGKISDYSNNFIENLISMRVSASCSDRPIIFIGQSLGCLLIKRALSDVNLTVGVYDTRLPVHLIIFFGAPHKGLHTAALETLVRGRPTEDMIRELRPESATLTDLNKAFRHVAKDIDILTCYELNPTKTVIKLPDGSWKREGPAAMMVTSDSAQQYWPREMSFACNADHAQLAKLKRGESGVYPTIRRAIQQKIHTSAASYTIVIPSEPDALQEQEVQSMDMSNRRKTELDDVIIDSVVAGDNFRLRYLLDKQYDVNCRDEEGLTILLLAAFLRQEGIIKMAFEYGADTWAATLIGYTTLHLVALDWVKSRINVVSYEDRKPLTRSIMELLLQHKPPLEKVSNETETPLHVAAQEGQILAAQCLIQHGADISAMQSRGSGGWSALHYAVFRQRKDMVSLLLAHGAPVNAHLDGLGTPLQMAAGPEFSKEGPSIVRSLIMAGADLEAVGSNSRTPLLYAITYRHIDFAEELLKWGPNIDARDDSGRSALHLAAYGGHVSMVRSLLKLGANPCTTDDAGYLPSNLENRNTYWFGIWNEIRQILRDAEKHWKDSHK